MQVKLIAHSQLTQEFKDKMFHLAYSHGTTQSNGQAIALTAIRTCYSHNNPSEIVELEGKKYFGSTAKDGKEGTEADRLLRHIVNSGHTSTLEHITFTFAIEGVSRSLLAQLTRHRHFSYSVQSQRYVKLESDSKSGGFEYVTPDSMKGKVKTVQLDDGSDWTYTAENIYIHAMTSMQEIYDLLRAAGVPAEDARYILPNAATCNLVLTGNLRSILEFYRKRNPSTHAQAEIQELAEKMKNEVISVEPWTEAFFKA